MKKADDLIDALAVGVLASKESSPVVIVGDKLETKQEELLKSKNPKEVTQVGGNGNENAFSQIVNIFKNKYNKEIESWVTFLRFVSTIEIHEKRKENY